MKCLQSHIYILQTFRSWTMHVCVHNHSHIYTRLCKGDLQPRECVVLCLLHRHAAPLHMRDDAGKEGHQKMKPAISIAIIYNAVAVGQPSFLEGILCGIPASIYEAWSSYYELRIFRIWKIHANVETCGNPGSVLPLSSAEFPIGPQLCDYKFHLSKFGPSLLILAAVPRLSATWANLRLHQVP